MILALLVAQAAATSALGLAPLADHPNLQLSGVAPPSAAALARSRAAQDVRAGQVLDVSTDGRQLLIATRFASTRQVHLVDHPDGVRRQLTFGDEPIADARFLPGDDRTVFFLRDAGGTEQFQLYRLDRRTAEETAITTRGRTEALVLSHEGAKMAWANTSRNGRDTDVYVADPREPLQAKRVSEREGTWLPLDFHPRGARQLLVSHVRSVQDSELWLLDLDKLSFKLLTPGPTGSLLAAAWSPDGRSVLLVTDRGGDKNGLFTLDPSLASPKLEPALLGVPGEVDGLAVAHDLGAPANAVVSVNQEGFSQLFLLPPGSRAPRQVPMPPGVVAGMKMAERRSDQLALSMTSPREPWDAFTLDLRTLRLTRWTRSETPGFDPSRMVQPDLVHLKAKDGLQFSALLYRPDDGRDRHPVVVLWHGGPEGQSRPEFSALRQQLLDRGLAVLLPNVRGSSGYGRKFLSLDNGVAREAVLQDIEATLDFVRDQPDLDASRVGVFGGSYGGYMALLTATFFPERVQVCVDAVGISSLPSFLASTSEYRRDLRRAEYGDERDPKVRAVLERISPLAKAKQIRAQLLVMQGHNDPRVPQAEAEQIVRAVRAAGGKAGYFLALDEGHGFAKRQNQVVAFALVEEFLTRALAPPGADPQPAHAAR